MTNYFGLEILQFPFSLVIFLNYIFGVYNVGRRLENIINIKNYDIKLLFYFIIFCSFIVLINYSIFFNIFVTKYLVFSFFLIFFVLNLLSIKNLNLKKSFFKKKLSLNLKLIIFFFICYFIVSTLPLSDADSLSYHSSFGANMIKYHSSNWLKNAELTHPDFIVSGFTEIFNYIGIILFTDNFGSYFNFVSLILIYLYFIKSFKNNKDTSFILLGIISSPILLPMVYSQKIYILPSFILALVFFNIYKSKKINSLNEVVILSSLMLVLSFKISFLYSVLIAIFYLIYKNKNVQKTFVLSFATSLIFFTPIIIKNFYFHADLIPPFTGQILNKNSEYLNAVADFLKNYDLSLSFKNLIFLPLLFLLPHYGQAGTFFFSLPNIGKIYGLQFFNFLNDKKKLNKEILFILILLIASVVFTGNISTRWFLFLFFLIQLFVCYLDIKINTLFKKINYLQIILFGFFLLAYSVYAFPTLLSKEYKNDFLKKHANGYDFAIKLNEIKKKYKIDENEKILYSHRAQFWTDVSNGHLNFSNEWMPLFRNRADKILLKKEFVNLIKDKKVKILVIKEKIILEKLYLKDSFFEKCEYEYGSFSANHATRNIFFSGKKKYNWIYFKNFDLLECLKNE